MTAALTAVCMGAAPIATAEAAPPASAQLASVEPSPHLGTSTDSLDTAGIWYCFEYMNPNGEVEWICVDI